MPAPATLRPRRGGRCCCLKGCRSRIDLLKAYFQIDAHDDARRLREKVTGKLVSPDEALQATLPAFMALLDLPFENAAWQALDPPEHRQRTLDSVKRLSLRESQAQTLLVVFEDLHWIDSETQALLDSLIEPARGSIAVAHELSA